MAISYKKTGNECAGFFYKVLSMMGLADEA